MSKLSEEELNKEPKTEEVKENEIIMELELGDVIKIFNPQDDNLNEKSFIIDYIDPTKMRIIDVDNLNEVQLKINEDGIIGDGSITKISLLSRSEYPGYAKQNDLLPGKWINIYFGGDIPLILTGEITNLEGDMIEIKTFPDKDIIYINFDYKGIPEDLPIENIEIREPPELTKKLEEQIEEGDIELPGLPEEKEKIDIEQIKLKVPVEDVKEQFREFILRADQIKFGYEELGSVFQYKDVDASAERYSLEVQLSDLQDELLSTIPNAQRTNRVLNNIHIMIERFKQLRELFSDYDEYGNVDGVVVYDANYKPLVSYFTNFNINLYWILPVVKNVKKIFDVGNSIEQNEDNTLNIQIDTTLNDIQNIAQLQESYKANQLTNDENKYISLYKQLDKFMNPFSDLNEENLQDIIFEKDVNSNINVILNNLDELYSAVVAKNNITKRRFIIQKYNLGLSCLSASNFTGQKMTAVKVKLTDSDLLSLNSIITLPEPTIRFSRINLPGSNILDRASLNEYFLNYWELLRKSTKINSIIIDNFDQKIKYNENNFVNNIKNYILDNQNENFKDIPKYQLYKEFLKHIIPKTRIIFNLMSKYITGKLSIVDVVSYLEPFLIYTHNLTYMQYKEIISFIYQKISEYNKKYVDRAKIFYQLKRLPSERHSSTNSFNLLKLLDDNKIKVEITDLYNLTDHEYVKGNLYTNSEILNKIIKEDCGKLYNSGLSKESIPLMFPNDFSSILNQEKINKNKIIDDEKKKKTCKDIIIAKHYDNESQLNDDNEIEIYFDKKYDLTNYGILDNYEKEMLNMTPENFLVFLISKLKDKYKLSDQDADYLADTLINGHKRVIDGQYAVLYLGIESKEPFDYYVRNNNKWELDDTIEKETSTDDSNLLCNLQEKCISNTEKNSNDDNCETYELSEKKIQNKILENILSEFDNKYKLSNEAMQKKIEEEFKYNTQIMPVLVSIKNYNLLKYNNFKYNIGLKEEEVETQVIISPYLKLRDLILGQQDFVKKQNDIIKFVSRFTRKATDGFDANGLKESPYWLYCTKTNTKLLPIFKFNMASAFLNTPDDYNDFVDLLIKEVGKLSDDGNYWVDVHSGWTIKMIDYDVEEGYEEGFKVSSRAILEEDIGNKLIAEKVQNIKYTSPEMKMINNIINAISIFMGINIETQKEFIINAVTEAIRKLMPNEELYKKYVKDMANKNKTVPSYEDLYYTTLLYNTLGSIIVGIQTSIPSINTRRTFPGCVKSFTGYPFDGSGDYSSINYIACVAFQIKSKDKPWYVLKGKSQEYIFNKIKSALDGTEKMEGLISQQEIKRKIDEKSEYLLLNPESQIPKEHDIQNWINFLPPLIPFKLKGLINISSEFKSSLLSNLKSGSPDQREKILMVESKIIQFSLAVQEAIQNVINKKKLILTNVNNEPYIENSCCNDKNKLTTINYFERENSHITEYNQIVSNLNQILADITSYTKSPMYQSIINTKNNYPAISNTHSDETIYLSYINFCHFRSLIPINEDLLPLCTDKPTLLQNESITEIISKLKNEGRNYTKDSFLRLLQIVNRNNIVFLDNNHNKISCISQLSKALEEIDDENDEIVEGSLRELIMECLNTFDIASTEDKLSKETKDLNNYLSRNITNMRVDIIDFVNKYVDTKTSKKIMKKFNNFINDIDKWNILETEESTQYFENKISDDSLYKINNFMKTIIDYVVNVFPNIILNKVDYKNLQIPSYWKLSINHNNDIKKYISEFYENLRIFYDNNIIYNVLTNIQKSCKNIVLLSKVFPSFTSIKIDDNKEIKAIFDERTSRLLFEYLFLRVLINYRDLTDDSNMIVREIEKEQVVEDIFSTEYLNNYQKKIDIEYESSKEIDFKLLGGDKKKLKQNISSLLIIYSQIISDEKDVIDVSYKEIQDRVFKLREKEKNLVTDRLKFLTDEERDADTALKINKLGPIYSKGLQKSLVEYDIDAFEEDKEFRDKINKFERMISRKTGMTGDNLDEYVNDYMEEQLISDEIDREVYDMSYMDEDYMDGHVDGYSAPDVEDQEYYDS